VARIATGWGVGVAANIAVSRVGVALAMFVARDTGKGRVVGGVDVAIAAGHPASGMRSRVDGEPRVVEHRSQPGSRVVAGGAGRGKVRRLVIGIVRTQVVGLVTGIAVRWRALVLAIDVALLAGNGRVRPSQGELRLAVVKLRPVPR